MTKEPGLQPGIGYRAIDPCNDQPTSRMVPQAQLRLQREYYSDDAVAGAEAALNLILKRIETLCVLDGADQLVSRLLRCIDAATGCLIAADPKKVH